MYLDGVKNMRVGNISVFTEGLYMCCFNLEGVEWMQVSLRVR